MSIGVDNLAGVLRGRPRKYSKEGVDLSAGDFTWTISMSKRYRVGSIVLEFSSPVSPTVRIKFGKALPFNKTLSSATNLTLRGEAGDEYQAGDDIEIFVSSVSATLNAYVEVYEYDL